MMNGVWRAENKAVEWVSGPRDGLMVVRGTEEGYIVVKDVKDDGYEKVLMKKRNFEWKGARWRSLQSKLTPHSLFCWSVGKQ